MLMAQLRDYPSLLEKFSVPYNTFTVVHYYRVKLPGVVPLTLKYITVSLSKVCPSLR